MDRNKVPDCACGAPFIRVLDAPAVQADIEPYISPASGKVINSKVQRRQDLKAGGYIEYEPGMREQIEKRRQESVANDVRKVESGIDNIVRDMNANGRL